MPGLPAVTSQQVSLKLTLPCDFGEVRSAIRSLHPFLTEQGWAGELAGFDLALAEACNNAVKYATAEGRLLPFILEVIAEESQIEFRVTDHTPGFDWPPRVECPEPESEGGRGLFLICAMMDYAGYFRGRGANLLVLRKHRPQAAVPPPPKAPPPAELAARLAESDKVIGEMMEELSSCYESLAAIFRYSGEQGRTGDLKEFAHRLFGDLLQIVSAEWFVLRLSHKDEAGPAQLMVYAASEPALELAPVKTPAVVEEAVSLETEAAWTRQNVWFDPRRPAPPADPLAVARPGAAGIVHPVLLNGQLIGTLALGRTPPPVSDAAPGRLVFTAGQLNVINTFADFLAVQIANSRFQEEQIKQRLVSLELRIAKDIQRSLLPTTLPSVPGWTLAAYCRSAREVGGDFYDVLKLDEGCLMLVIADVMGKGIPAAMFAAILRTVLRAAPELSRNPAMLLQRVNSLLYPELSAVDMFITAQLAVVDAKAGILTMASAGHCPLLVADAGGVRALSPEGMPLGIMPDTPFLGETVTLPEHCRLLLYTDGVNEASNDKREQFGEDQLMGWLKQTMDRPGNAGELKDRLVRELDVHRSIAALNDDQTFLIMSR